MAKRAKKEQWPPAHGLPAANRFKRLKRFSWGETPFDDLSRGELLRLAQAYHSALVAARSVMAMHATDNPSLYWTIEGVGGRALAKANYLMKLSREDSSDQERENIYRSFFRTADTLLFPHKRQDKFHDWGVNAKGEMIAPQAGQQGFRPIKWADVLPGRD